MIYNYLYNADMKYSTRIHNLNSYKYFTFSWLQIPKKKIEKDYIKILSEEIVLYISSPTKDFINILANGIIKTSSPQFGSLEFELKQLEVLPEPELKSTMEFACLSPIVVTTKKYFNGKLVKYYYKPNDEHEEIVEKIRNNLIKKYKNLYYEDIKNSINIKFNQKYLSKSKVLVHYIKDKLDIKIPAIMCPFVISGSKELIKFGYECGFGELNSAGFGMVKIV